MHPQTGMSRALFQVGGEPERGRPAPASDSGDSSPATSTRIEADCATPLPDYPSPRVTREIADSGREAALAEKPLGIGNPSRIDFPNAGKVMNNGRFQPHPS